MQRPGVSNQIRIAHAHVQPQPQPPAQQRPSIPVDLNHRLAPATATANVGQVSSTGTRQNPESPMPLSEDEFYKWQMKFKTRYVF